MKYDLLIVAGTMMSFSLEYGESVQVMDRARGTGTLKDGRSFRVISASSHGWLEQIRGARYREYKLIGHMLNLTRNELASIQAMVQK